MQRRKEERARWKEFKEREVQAMTASDGEHAQQGDAVTEEIP